MSWQSTEFLLKGVYLGLLVYVGLQLGDADGWRGLGQVALFTLGGLALFLSAAAARMLAKGYRIKGRLFPFLAFLIMENPTLVYAGILLGMAAGAFSLRPDDPETWQLAWTLGGGAVLGLLFLNLKNTDAKLRFCMSVLLSITNRLLRLMCLSRARQIRRHLFVGLGRASDAFLQKLDARHEQRWTSLPMTRSATTA